MAQDSECRMQVAVGISIVVFLRVIVGIIFIGSVLETRIGLNAAIAFDMISAKCFSSLFFLFCPNQLNRFWKVPIIVSVDSSGESILSCIQGRK